MFRRSKTFCFLATLLTVFVWLSANQDASAQDSGLRAHCQKQNALCTSVGCTENPGPSGVTHCREVVCGGRLASCLKSGCYQWSTRPASCFVKGADIPACPTAKSCDAAAANCRQTQSAQPTAQLNCDRVLAECKKTGIWRGAYVTCRIAK